MVTRDFDAMLADRAGVRPTFQLGGQKFTVKAKLPFKKFRTLLAQFTADDVDESEVIDEFMSLALIPQDRERFFDLLNQDGDDNDEWSTVSPEQVASLTEWLMELYTGKRAENSDASSGGSEKTGASPKVVSLNSRSQSA